MSNVIKFPIPNKNDLKETKRKILKDTLIISRDYLRIARDNKAFPEELSGGRDIIYTLNHVLQYFDIYYP